MATPKVAERSKKCLRSLNDVLGKASSLCKDTKPVAGIVSNSITSVRHFVDVSCNVTVIPYCQAPKLPHWVKRKLLGGHQQ